MKPEEIAKLRAWSMSDDYDRPDYTAVEHALDEREALLGWCKAALLHVAGPQPLNDDEFVAGIRTAIEKAES